MLRIGKLTDYATVVMAELAEHPGECWSASQVAEATRLELPTVAKVLKTLARSRLIESVRGVNGGYRLHYSPDSVSVAAIIRAMEGPIALTECGLEPGLCSREHDCNLKGNWQRIGETVENALESLTLADLAAPRDPGLRLVTRTSPAAEPRK
ncbi:MAG TPA: SUF system Fe-S cluster assembly regulator [Wenzhouxiangellaceae bacterium]|nr:SUF system Fe-S cluster assembly regulator [Wenzhouxiangellaceae bacterium]